LMQTLPRQLKFGLQRINDPDFALKVTSKEIKELNSTLNRGFHLLFLGLVMSAIILGLFIRYR
ncbi:hypothetical protein ACEV73_23865, partial [Vibrio parahaemolyticus]